MKSLTKQTSWKTLYTIPALILMVLLYVFVWISGRSLFMGSDGFTMQYTATMYFKEFWGAFLTGDFIQMDLTIGEGLNPMLTMGYYGLTDPLNIIFSFAHESNVFVLYAINMLLRWWLCGFCAGLYLKTRTDNDKAVATGALIYAFSGFMLIWQFCPAILSTGYLFPLLLLTFERAMKQRKYVAFVLVSTLAYLTNYYMAILMSMAILVYAILLIVHNCRKTKGIHRENVNVYLHTALSHAVGLMLSAWMLVPMIIYFMSGTRVEAAHTFSPFFFEGKYYLDALISFFTPSAGATAFFTQTPKLIVSISPLLIPIILLALQKQKRSLISIGTTILCIVMACVPLCAQITSMTGYPVHRWTFVLSMVLCMCYVKHIEKLEKLSVTQKAITCILLLLSAVFNFWNIHTAAAVMNVLVTIVACVAVIKPSVKAFYRATCVICAIMMFAWVLGAENLANFMFRGVWRDPSYNVLSVYEEQLKDNDLNNRVSWIAHAGNTNSGTVHGIYTNHISWNSLPAGVNYYNQYVQQYPTISAAYWPLNHDARQAYHMLGATKYFIADIQTAAPYAFNLVYSDDVYSIWESTYDTSIGYGFTEKMSLQQFKTLNAAQQQIALMRYAIVDENCESIDMETYELKYTTKDGKIVVEVPEYTELYMTCNATTNKNFYEILLKDPEWWSQYPNGLEYWKTTVTVTAVGASRTVSELLSVRHPNTYPSYYAPQKTVCFGSALNGTVTFEWDVQDSVMVSDIKLYAIPLGEYDNAIVNFEKNTLQNATDNNGTITGTINAAEDMVMQIAVPYQKGWQAYVDGVPVDIFASGVQYIGFNVTAGEHNVELRYETPGMSLGVIMALFGILALGANIGITVYKKKKMAA